MGMQSSLYPQANDAGFLWLKKVDAAMGSGSGRSEPAIKRLSVKAPGCPSRQALVDLINQVFDSPPDGFCSATTATSGPYKASKREINS